ncbi:MAG: hypothetical protein RL653_3270 [Pseudomonadota bacterium]|jgi:hypothetical protein
MPAPRTLVLLLLALGLYAALARRLFGFTPDDVFIFLRYARRWAAGEGPTYNPGEWVQGFTSTAWTALLALAEKYTGDPLWTAKVVGAVLGGGVLLATHGLAERTLGARRFPVAPLLLCAALDLPQWSASGMETPLFVLLANMALLLSLSADRGGVRPVLLALAVGAAGWTRPEGWVLGPLLLLCEWSRTGARPSRAVGLALAAGLLLGALQPLWALLTFGSVLPNTWYAKRLPLLTALSSGVRYLRDFSEFVDGPLFALLAGAGLLLHRARASLRSPALFGAAFVAACAWVGGDSWTWIGSQRFLLVVLPVLAVLAEAGLESLWVAVEPSLSSRAARAGGLAVGVLTLLLLLNPSGVGARPVGVVAGDRALAGYLHAHERPGDVLVASDIGQFGYFTGLRVFDTYGLVTPFVSRELRKRAVNGYPEEDTRKLVEEVLRLDARFVVLKGTVKGAVLDVHDECAGRQLYGDPRFGARYLFVRAADENPYLLFVRKDALPPA